MRAVLNRWPTALALIPAVLTIVDGGADHSLAFALATVLPLLPLLYLVTAKVRRPSLVWAFLGGGFALVAGLGFVDAYAPTIAFGVIALAVLIWSVVDGHIGEPGFRWQLLGLAAFGGIAVAALFSSPWLGTLLVGIGWLLHAGWDAWHLWKKKVVAGTFAEFCAVVDLVLGGALIAAAVTAS